MIKDKVNNWLNNLLRKNCLSCKCLIKDYKFVYEQASEVYSEVTGGRLSKGRYYAGDVIVEYEDYNNKHYKELYKSDIEVLPLTRTLPELKKALSDLQKKNRDLEKVIEDKIKFCQDNNEPEFSE